MIRFKNFIEYITKVTVIIFLSSEISLADFDDVMDAINKGNYEQATKNRDILIEELSEDDVRKALKLQERCLERNFQNCSDLM